VQELSVDDVKKDIINFINKPKFKEASFSDFLSSIDPLKISEQYIVTCFLALLELVKYQKIILTQNNKDSEIYFVRNKIKSAMQEMIEF
jgi:segregation and condensation protein A